MRTTCFLPVFPSMHRMVYLPRMCTCWGCTYPGGLPAWGVPTWGVYLSRVCTYLRCTCPGGVPTLGVYLLGVYLPWGTCPGGYSWLGVYLLGVYLPRGVPVQGCTCWGGCTYPGGCTYLGVPLPGGMYLPGGVPAQGVYLLRLDVPAQGGVPAQVLPLCEQNSWYTLLKILPCPKLRLRANYISISYKHNVTHLELFISHTKSCPSKVTARNIHTNVDIVAIFYQWIIDWSVCCNLYLHFYLVPTITNHLPVISDHFMMTLYLKWG